MELPAMFSSLQERADELPANWQAANIHQLPGLAEAFIRNKTRVRDLHRSLKANRTTGSQPQPNNTNNNSNSNNTSNSNSNIRVNTNNTVPITDPVITARQNRIYADIMSDTFQIGIYISQVPPGSCVYHANAHLGETSACSVIRRIYAKAASRDTNNASVESQLLQMYTQQFNAPAPAPAFPVQQPTQVHQAHHLPPATPQQTRAAHTTMLAPPTSTPTQIQHAPAATLQEISLEELHDVVAAATGDEISKVTPNSKNPQSIAYFCTHKTAVLENSIITNDQQTCTILIDSGASHTLIKDKSLFQTFNPWNGSKHVVLADGTTSTPILGEGTITATASNGKSIVISHCLYVSTLSSSLLATKALSLLPNHHVSTSQGITTITFPSFTLQTCDSIDDPLIYINVKPITILAHNIETQPQSQTHDSPNPQGPTSATIEDQVTKPQSPHGVVHRGRWCKRTITNGLLYTESPNVKLLH